ncbi:MAG: hypothetical protein Q9220_006621 [cf. Caloplaca sp. 1 TL-2023]
MSAGGLEYAASVAGLISLSLTVFRGCVQGFEIIQSAVHIGSEANNFRCKLEIEQYRLMQWADRIRLKDKPSEQLNWNLIADILQQLLALLSDTQRLKKKYHLELVQVEGCNPLAPGPNLPTKAGFGKLLSIFRPDYAIASSRILQESNGPLRKLRWAIFDKGRASALINEIIHFNNCLNSLLDAIKQNHVKSAMTCVLRNPVALASAANLRQIRLILGLGPAPKSTDISVRKPPANGPMLQLRQLKSRRLQREFPRSAPHGREFARYKSDPVIIEWKFIEKEYETDLKTRVHHIAILLAHTRDTSFHSLHCIGILSKDKSYQPADERFVCYGLVFELIIPKAPSLVLSPHFQPLSVLFSQTRRPSLNERCDIALAIAETVLQLHTSGWVHGGIRSESILFIDIGYKRWEDGTADGPYLVGYDFARPTNAQTKMVPIIPEQEVYRHPRSQGQGSARFRRSFDLFALGCVLLEIGLWSGLLDVLERFSSSSAPTSGQIPARSAISSDMVNWSQLQTTKTRLLQNDDPEGRRQLAGIAFHAGTTFQEAILLCLYAKDDDPDDEDISVQKEVVDLLRRARF